MSLVLQEKYYEVNERKEPVCQMKQQKEHPQLTLEQLNPNNIHFQRLYSWREEDDEQRRLYGRLRAVRPHGLMQTLFASEYTHDQEYERP